MPQVSLNSSLREGTSVGRLLVMFTSLITTFAEEAAARRIRTGGEQPETGHQ